MESIEKKEAIHGFSWMFIANLLVVVLKLVTIPIMARILSPEEFGLVALCMAIITFVAMVGGRGGLSSALIAFKDNSKNSWNAVFTFSLFLGGFLAALLGASANTFSVIFGFNDLLVFYALITVIPFQFVCDVLINRLLLERKFRQEAIVSIISESIAGVIAIVLAFYGAGVWSLVIQHLLALIIRMSTISIFLYFPRTSFDFRVIKKIYRFSIYSILVEVFNFIFFNVPIIVASKFIGNYASGIISVQSRISALPSDIIIQGVSKVIYPLLSSDKIDRLNADRGVIWSSSINTFLVTPILLGISALSDPIVEIVLGEKYINFSYVLFSLALMRGVMIPFASINPYLKSVGKIKLLCFMFAIRSVILLITLYFYKEITISNICKSVLISTFISIPIYLLLLYRFSSLNMLYFLKGCANYALGSAFMFSVVFYINQKIDENTLWNLIIQLFVAFFLYYIYLFVFVKKIRKIYNFKMIKQFLIDIY